MVFVVPGDHYRNRGNKECDRGHKQNKPLRATRGFTSSADSLRESTRGVSGDEETGIPSLLLRVVRRSTGHIVFRK